MVSLDVMASTPLRADRAHLRKVVIGWGQPSRVAGASCGEIPGRGESLVTEPDARSVPRPGRAPHPWGSALMPPAGAAGMKMCAPTLVPKPPPVAHVYKTHAQSTGTHVTVCTAREHTHPRPAARRRAHS